VRPGDGIQSWRASLLSRCIDEAETLVAVAHPGAEVRKQNPVTFGQPGVEAADVIAGLDVDKAGSLSASLFVNQPPEGAAH
jgi:hypothetical protein